MSKYIRTIKGVDIDVYDILKAWKVENPALAHLIKKALQPGERGHKNREQDLIDIHASAVRACELEGFKIPVVKTTSGPFNGDVLLAYDRGVKDGMTQMVAHQQTQRSSLYDAMIANEGSEP